MMIWNRTMTAGLALVVASAGGYARAQAPAPANTPQTRGATDRPAGDLPGPIDSFADVEDTGKMLFKLADSNNDGQISRKEATDAGNLIVGGFFFRADQNGDGALSQDEAKAAREAVYAQQPILRYVLEKSRYQAKQAGNNAAANPVATVGDLLDSNNDKQLQASEVRGAVETAVQAVYSSADTNRDGQMTPNEINSALVGAVQTGAQAAFKQADADNNNQLSRDEFNNAIIEPASMVFAILDGNNDGQVSAEEIQQAQRIIGNQMRYLMVPDATRVRGAGAANAYPGTAPAPAAAPAPGR